MRPAVVLVRPTEEGNVGAVARAMANMGLAELVLVEPACALGSVARAFAVGAHGVLDGLRREASLAAALAPCRRVVGTTSARQRQLPCPVLAPRELPALLAQDPPSTPTALVFGPEASGLTVEELARCSAVVTIPAALAQPTLNLAQAVLILAYELHMGAPAAAATSCEPPATTAELEGLWRQLDVALTRVGFARDTTYAGVLRDLRRLVARAAPSSREVRILRGVCRRLGRGPQRPDDRVAGS